MSNLKPVLVDGRTYNIQAVRSGGMGRVWLLEQAFDESVDPIYSQQIAVKTFDFADDVEAIEHELNVWISLDHTSILPLKKIGRLNYRLAAIMPHRAGSMEDLIEQAGSLREGIVVQVLMAIADGLEYAWTTHNILHLDIKPSNILFVNYNTFRVEIADWGIARLAAKRRLANLDCARALTNRTNNKMTAHGAGTPLFMAPERFSHNWKVSPEADIYSIGMMAIQLSTGILPFRLVDHDPLVEIASGSYFDNAYQLLAHHTSKFRKFCLQCIHPQPSKRPRTFHAVSKMLKSLSKQRA